MGTFYFEEAKDLTLHGLLTGVQKTFKVVGDL
jgi:hypothetical protein